MCIQGQVWFLIISILDHCPFSYLACDCGVSRLLIMTYYRFCKKYFLKIGLVFIVYYSWYIAFIESYSFLCIKKTIEQIDLNGFLSVQNTLFYN